MAPLPEYRPKKLSLGSLETEILEIIWELGTATVKQIHDRILADPERELAYASVTTVLNRLTQKGWLKCFKQNRAFSWQPLVSREQAKTLQAYEQLQQFLAISNPDMVASFAESLDTASLEQLDAIATRLQAIRRQREKP
ncbi:BlaI/MecI/CopY family transcriptional regulator [Crocosphaera sp. UHCC 0190]|uniref:BlaI/MecI/CopY family transcriptional regulator n=1 Tax=Crocosphaera sp. UHCC 0190 TaxID=3110246 RepID=UPI002B21787F|nr:BlaI/MecI/CopY family transcriptional regulator [Crocosphaera sp. UHCC 0190]MEA5511680.1 BlaI/MecI/CopY family transcriptional regulator [Crocosphaera sp. UHCC 0190]